MRRLLLILSTIFLGTCVDSCMSALNYAHAAQKPAISVISTSVDEGTTATIQASRTGDLSRSSSVIFSTSNATAISGTNYTAKSGTLTFAPGASRSSSSSVITRRDGKVTGNLYFVVRLGVVSNAMIQANGTVTVRNLDQPPPPPAVVWTHCADEGQTCYANGTVLVRYGKGTTWSATFQQTGPFACNNSLPGGDPLVGTVKECQIVGTPGSAPPPAPVQCPDGSTVPAGQTCPTPPPPVITPPPNYGSWVPAAVSAGGYACNGLQLGSPNTPPCGQGIVYKVVAITMSVDAVPVPIATVQFFQDLSGQYPSINPYWATTLGYVPVSDLRGIAPSASIQ